MQTGRTKATKRNRNRSTLPAPLEAMLPRIRACCSQWPEEQGPGPAGWTPEDAARERDIALEILASGAEEPAVMEQLIALVGFKVWGWMSGAILKLFFMGLHEDGLALCRRMLAIRNDEHLAFTLPMLLARAGRVEETLSQIEANLREHPDHPIMLMMAGDTYQILGDRHSAEPLYRRALDLCSARPDPSWTDLAGDLKHRLQAMPGPAGGAA